MKDVELQLVQDRRVEAPVRVEADPPPPGGTTVWDQRGSVTLFDWCLMYLLKVDIHWLQPWHRCTRVPNHEALQVQGIVGIYWQRGGRRQQSGEKGQLQ